MFHQNFFLSSKNALGPIGVRRKPNPLLPLQSAKPRILKAAPTKTAAANLAVNRKIEIKNIRHG
jgi:hypothetical protein